MNEIYTGQTCTESTEVFFVTRNQSIEKTNEIGGLVLESQFLSVLLEDAKIDIETLIEKAKSRNKEFCEPRQIHLAFRAIVLKMTYKKAAIPYGKNHATVIHSIKNVLNFYHNDRQYRRKFCNTFTFIISICPDFLSFNGKS